MNNLMQFNLSIKLVILMKFVPVPEKRTKRASDLD